jgi:hypothetical protein
MISSEVQRTLVKSPPELWAELSDPTALARHLGELGEIRIVRTDPESTVEWAAENTTGTVSIKPSGWGTKVTLSVTRETAAPTPESAAEVEVTQAREPDANAEAVPGAAAERQPPTPDVQPEPAIPDVGPELTSSDVEPEPTAAELEPEPAYETETAPRPAPRRGFFARLFGRRRAVLERTPAVTAEATSALEDCDRPAQSVESARVPGQPDAFAAVTQALEPAAFAEAHPFAVVPPVTKLALGDISAELMAAESIAAEDVSAEEVTAVLTAVLDRLGAAHHRPFSRS